MRLLIGIVLLLTSTASWSQDYSVQLTHPNAVGQPGQLFLAQIKVQNNSNEDILMHYKRIVNNLPGNWTSCFCYPQCIAPWIDSAAFSIPALSVDSIMPNFGTDSIPAMATVQIVLWQGGYENARDTITFTGSTLASGMESSNSAPKLSIYPNPTSNIVTIESSENGTLEIRNCSGGLVSSKQLFPGQTVFDVSTLPAGVYFFEFRGAINRPAIIRVIKSE